MGAHVFVAGGLARAGLRYAHDIGAEVVQVFASNPRGWAPSRPDPREDEAFRSGCVQAGLSVFVHAPYLVNLASPALITRERSRDALVHALDRARRIGAAGVVVHCGSAVAEQRREVALRDTRELLLPVLDALADDDPDLLLEPTAGGGSPVAATVPQLGRLVDVLDGHPRLKVCFDTCHAHAAGHDLAVPGGLRRTLTALVRAVGSGRLRLVHANDSKDPCGSGRDRHSNLGSGTIGAAAFAELFRHPATRGVPVLVETPGTGEAQRADVALLKAQRDAS